MHPERPEGATFIPSHTPPSLSFSWDGSNKQTWPAGRFTMETVPLGWRASEGTHWAKRQMGIFLFSWEMFPPVVGTHSQNLHEKRQPSPPGSVCAERLVNRQFRRCVLGLLEELLSLDPAWSSPSMRATQHSTIPTLTHYGAGTRHAGSVLLVNLLFCSRTLTFSNAPRPTLPPPSSFLNLV